jgi:hypothetical protein
VFAKLNKGENIANNFLSFGAGFTNVSQIQLQIKIYENIVTTIKVTKHFNLQLTLTGFGETGPKCFISTTTSTTSYFKVFIEHQQAINTQRK